jgi:hypothetical protein
MEGRPVASSTTPVEAELTQINRIHEGVNRADEIVLVNSTATKVTSGSMPLKRSASSSAR